MRTKAYQLLLFAKDAILPSSYRNPSKPEFYTMKRHAESTIVVALNADESNLAMYLYMYANTIGKAQYLPILDGASAHFRMNSHKVLVTMNGLLNRGFVQYKHMEKDDGSMARIYTLSTYMAETMRDFKANAIQIIEQNKGNKDE